MKDFEFKKLLLNVFRKCEITEESKKLQNWMDHKAADRAIENALYILPDTVLLVRMMENIGSCLSQVDEKFKEISEGVKKFKPETAGEIQSLDEQQRHFSSTLVMPGDFARYRQMYSDVKRAVGSFVSEQPALFSAKDAKVIEGLLDDPDEAIKKINPHTISLISDLEILP